MPHSSSILEYNQFIYTEKEVRNVIVKEKNQIRLSLFVVDIPNALGTVACRVLSARRKDGVSAVPEM